METSIKSRYTNDTLDRIFRYFDCLYFSPEKAILNMVK